MKNKKLSLVWALVLAVSLMTFSVSAAASATVDGTAGIEFTEGDITVINPGDSNLTGIYSPDIHFGDWEIDSVNHTYLSTGNSRLDPSTQYAGFIVDNPTLSGWSVSVKMDGGFKVGTAATMNGFTLTLAPQAGGPVTTAGNMSAPPTASASAALDATGSTSTIFVADVNNAEGRGQWGCNWSGALLVPAGSVTTEGEAQATMIWTLEIVPAA